MAGGDIPKSPNVFHPTKPSAVGSRNSLFQDGRNQKEEFVRALKDEADMVLDEIKEKLPPEVLSQLDVMGGLKEKLYNYFNQNYQNMFNRYVTTAEDEMVKKIRGFVDREETKVLCRYAPKEIAQIIDQIAGPDKFNTGEIEKSIVNIYGHLQGHVQRGMNDLENETNSMLRQKEDVGAFVRGENAYSIAKCSFKDSASKPKTVTQAKLSINILEPELISPIFHYQTSIEFLIKDQISNTVMDLIDREASRYQDELVDQGKEEQTDTELMFDRIRRVPEYTDDETENPDSRRYRLMAKDLIGKIEGLRAEINLDEFDPMNIRENIKRIIDIENIRNRGFNTAINNLTSILDTSKMGYQYIENLKNAREVVIREYEDVDISRLPDERYAINLRFYDSDQLLKERESYDRQMEEFHKEILRVWDDAQAVYIKGKRRGINDYEDLSRSLRGIVKKHIKDPKGDPLYDEAEKTWNEIMRLKTEETEVERLNRTYLYEKDLLKKLLREARSKVANIYGYSNPKERLFIDNRVMRLEKEFDDFDYLINPYHIQPGLILDIDITSIKRKKYTLRSMANVLNEFLNSVSKGFQDAAFASFKRRRSTVREDMTMSFSADVEGEGEGEPELVAAPTAGASSSENSGGSGVASSKASPGRSSGGGRGKASVNREGKADVTPQRKKVNIDELSEL